MPGTWNVIRKLISNKFFDIEIVTIWRVFRIYIPILLLRTIITFQPHAALDRYVHKYSLFVRDNSLLQLFAVCSPNLKQAASVWINVINNPYSKQNSCLISSWFMVYMVFFSITRVDDLIRSVKSVHHSV